MDCLSDCTFHANVYIIFAFMLFGTKSFTSCFVSTFSYISYFFSACQEYPTLTTFFAGEIISRKRPFLTRKWDADEDVDRKHWVRCVHCCPVTLDQ